MQLGELLGKGKVFNPFPLDCFVLKMFICKLLLSTFSRKKMLKTFLSPGASPPSQIRIPVGAVLSKIGKCWLKRSRNSFTFIHGHNQGSNGVQFEEALSQDCHLNPRAAVWVSFVLELPTAWRKKISCSFNGGLPRCYLSPCHKRL